MSHFKLRPHHLLCITFFEGKGYSDEFVENMTSIINSLQNDSRIQLTENLDIICSKCPNHYGEFCNSNDKVKRYDKAVLEACRLEAGQQVKWQDLKEFVNNQILQLGKLHEICGDCQWNMICQKKASNINFT